MKLIFQIIWFVIIVLILAFLFFMILFPSHLSYTSMCMPETFEEKYADIYEITGSAGINTSLIIDEQAIINITEEDIEIFVLYEDKRIYKHELIHKSQILRGWNYIPCNKPIERILFEAEAYLGQNYPDFLYNFIYRMDIDEEINLFENN